MSLTATAGVLLDTAFPALAWGRSTFPAPASLPADAGTAAPRGCGSEAVSSPARPLASQPVHNLCGRHPGDGEMCSKPCGLDRMCQSDGGCQTHVDKVTAVGAWSSPSRAGAMGPCGAGGCSTSFIPRDQTHQYASTSSTAPPVRIGATVPKPRRCGDFPTAGGAAPARLAASEAEAAAPSEASSWSQRSLAPGSQCSRGASISGSVGGQGYAAGAGSCAGASRAGSTSGAGGGASAGGGWPDGGAPGRRPAFGVRPSQLTSHISTVQRNEAATVIQAAWRGYRIRRLYLRLIVARRRPPGGAGGSGSGSGSCPGGGGGGCGVEADAGHVYRGLRQFPPIPSLPPVSRFTTLGRPHAFHAQRRRVWFGLDEPPASASASASASAPPPGGGGGPRSPLRLSVPPRAQADVPMSEVERILAGGFWRDEPPQQPPAAAAGPAGGGGVGGGGGEEEEVGLSMYMRAKMRQEEREAEEALQMLSYEPNDLIHKLGSLKERTLGRLGSLGRSIGGTLASGRLLPAGSRTGGAAGGDGGGPPPAPGGAAGPSAPGGWGWSGAGAAGGGAGGGARAAWSLPRVGGEPRLWAAGGGGARRHRPGHDSDLHVPLLRVVDAAGHEHTQPPPPWRPHAGQGSCQQHQQQQQRHQQQPHQQRQQHGQWEVARQGRGEAARQSQQQRPEPLHLEPASPIAVNRQRYRSRSHVTRMSF